MKRLMKTALALTLALVLSPAAHANEAVIAVGQPAPAFTLTDSKGAAHSLGDFAGKTVVLEWTNPECPFVRKHYDGGNMQKLQADAAANGVVWLSVNSSAPGKQGHLDAAGAEALVAKEKAAPAAYLLDSDGKVGKAYGAVTTPHMFVIDGEGKLAYQGAIDDNSSADPKTVEGAKNYVTAALNELTAGKPVTEAQTKPYGCAVKYAD